GNAIKVTEQGKVTVSAVASDIKSSTPTLLIHISDTGIGISPDAVENLFQRFVQADVSVTRKHGGTGLGLEISRSLAHLMGGDIFVSSEPGKGSTFTLQIPTQIAVVSGETMQQMDDGQRPSESL